MDVNLMRAAVTVLSLAAFVGIVVWAWSARRQEQFNEAARLPLADDREPGDAR